MNLWKAVSTRRLRRNLLRIAGRASAMPTHPFVQQHRHQLISSDVFLVSYPRSGNTWMRLLLTDVFQMTLGAQAPSQPLVGYDEMIPDLDRGQWPVLAADFQMPFRLFKTHSVYHAIIRNAIVVVRDPADCLCSYFHFFRRHDPSQKCVRQGIDSFCLNNVGDWCFHASSYLRASQKDSVNVLWTSYEQLHSQPLRVLKSATAFLGLDANDSVCQQAIENQSFEKLRAKEEIGSQFHEYFFRTGQLNGGRKELGSKTIDTIERNTSEIYEQVEQLVSSSHHRAA